MKKITIEHDPTEKLVRVYMFYKNYSVQGGTDSALIETENGQELMLLQCKQMLELLAEKIL